MKCTNALAGALALACMSDLPARAQSALEWAAAQGRNAAVAAHGARVPAGGRIALASWYGGGERLNQRTASGEIFRPGAFTAAHRSLPLGTRLAVTLADRTIVVRVNDRGPAAWTGRSLDLSRGAALALGFAGRGTARVRFAILGG